MTAPTLDEIKGWPATVTVTVAAQPLGISRSHAYDLVRRGQFPVKVVPVGHRFRVVTADLVRLLSAADDNGRPAA